MMYKIWNFYLIIFTNNFCENPKGDLVTLFDQFQSLAKINDFKSKIEMETPASSNTLRSIAEKLILKISKQRDVELEKIEFMIR